MPFDGPAKLIPEADLARGCPKCDGRKITEQACIRKAREAELFEDGCEADLHDAGIKTLPAAYIQGRLDVLEEIDGN